MTGNENPNVLDVMAAYMSGSAPQPYSDNTGTASRGDFAFTGYHTTSLDAFAKPTLNQASYGTSSAGGHHAHTGFGQRQLMAHSSSQDLSILSSETHDDSNAVAHDSRAHNRPPTMMPSFGGVYVVNEPGQDKPTTTERSSSGEGDQQGPLKKSRKESLTSEEEANKQKSRGRPRLDTRDESASDRRRTQIRLAQRAYRLRKETTISSLKKQVETLESTIEEMNRSFVQFNDRALRSGLVQMKPTLAEDLQSTTRHFLALARAANAESEQEVEELDDESHEPAKVAVEPARVRTSTKRKASMDRPAVGQPSMTAPGIGPSAPELGQEHRRQSGPNNPFNASMSVMPHARPPQLAMAPANLRRPRQAGAFASSQHFQFRMPDPSAGAGPQSRAGMPIPSAQDLLRAHESSSMFEGTFGRRLRRACFEKAYYLLANTNAPVSERNRVFRYSFIYMNRDQVRAHLYDLLLGLNQDPLGPRESLRHRSQRSICSPDGTGEVMYRPFAGAAPPADRPTGHAVPSAGNSPPEVAPDMILEMAGMEGEWYGPEDIENYLREKGVKVDTRTSYADVEVADLTGDHLTLPDSPVSMSSQSGLKSSGASRQSPATTPPNNLSEGNPYTGPTEPPPQSFHPEAPPQSFHPEAPAVTNQYQSSVPSGFYLPKMTNDARDNPDRFGFGMAGVNAFSLPHIITAGISEGVRRKKKRVVTLDMSLLLQGISHKGICLGNSPGFRKEDVDRAIQNAMHSH